MLKDRLRRIEGTITLRRAGGVVRCGPDETPADAAARAEAAGRRAPFIAMPAIPDATTWQRECVEQQRQLAERAEVYMRTGGDPFKS